jgi:hypothetical protein
MMKKNVMMTIVAPTSYTQERKEGSKTIRRNTRKQMQTKTKRKITRGTIRNHGFSKGST